MVYNARTNVELLVKIIQEGIVLPFIFNKATINGDIPWTTMKRMFPKSMEDPMARLNCFHDRVRPLGLDEPIMPDQKDPDLNEIVIHEITAEEIDEQYEKDLAKEQGSIWNVDKPYSAIFMTKETHDKVEKKHHKNVSLVEAVADCVHIKLVSEDYSVIATIHSSAQFSTHDLISKSMDFAYDHFGIPEDKWIVIVGAYASSNWYYDDIPRFATLLDEPYEDEDGKWHQNQVLKDGKPIILPEWKDYLHFSEKDGEKLVEIDYKKKTEDQVEECGFDKMKVIYNGDCTITNPNYYSNARRFITHEQEGRNLSGIAFVDSPKGKRLLLSARNIKNGIIIG